jgi:hypothetical protein
MSHAGTQHFGHTELLTPGPLGNHFQMRRTKLIGALIAAVLGQGAIVAATATAAEPETTESPTLAAEGAEEAAEYVEEADLATESAVILEAHHSRYVTRKVTRLTREITHVRHLLRRARAKRVALKRLAPAAKRRVLALPRAREKIRRERHRLRHLRKQRRAIASG